MLLIISLLIVSIFIYFLKDSLKKHSYAYYIGAAVISVVVYIISLYTQSLFVKNVVLGIFTKGSIGTAMFVVVMYTGALPKGNRLIPPLMKIRGELSIMAAILVLCHNFTYGRTYFRMLFTRTAALSVTQRVAAVISLILILIMIVLTVISFPVIRRKMPAKKWKQLQRTAYVFYGLMYVHIMLINIPYARLGNVMYVINVIIYSIVFLGYAAMRITKAFRTKAVGTSRDYGRKQESVIYCIAAVVCVVMTLSCFVGRQSAVSASKDSEEWDEFFSQETIQAMVRDAEGKDSGTLSKNSDGMNQSDIADDSKADGSNNIGDGVNGSTDSGDSNNNAVSGTENNGAGNGSVNNNSNNGSNNGSDSNTGNNNANGINGSGTTAGNDSGTNNSSDSGNAAGNSNNSSGSDNAAGSGSNSSDSDNSASNGNNSQGNTNNTPVNTTFKADGTYTGSAVCDTYNYNVTVTIVISGDEITSVTATSDAGAQDQQYFNMANAQIPQQLLANQSTSGVDTVSGATKSSNAIKKAFYYAYKSAKK